MASVRILIFMVVLLIISSYLEASKKDDISYIMQRSGIKKMSFNMNKARKGQLLVTNLDDLRGLFIWVRQLFLNHIPRDWKELMDYNSKMGKLQKPHPKEEQFPCKLNNTRSAKPPKTVHELRPGDIDVIAAIGDSLSCGNGIISKTIIDILAEYRGLAFSGGGVDDWRTVLTLPNVLKVFNPQLYGFATGEVLTVNPNSHLSIAEPMIMSRDLVFQAHVFIARLKQASQVDFKNHWKLLTIFVGNNDICSDMCYYEDKVEFLRKHENDLRSALTLLRDNVPRLIINLLAVPNMVTTLYEMKNIPFECQAVYRMGCHCVFSDSYNATTMRKKYNNIKSWQAIDQYIAELPEFQTDDFAILYQPFTANISIPKLANGGTDFRYFASDCFHFSQLGHAIMANALWNNMMLPYGKKQTKFLEPFEQFECPTADRPFIAIGKNSGKK